METAHPIKLSLPDTPRRGGWRRFSVELGGFVRFLPFAREAALDRLHRTGAKAFVRDLPLLARLGFSYYRGMRAGSAAELGHVPAPTDPYESWLAVNQWTPGAQRELVHRLAHCAGKLPTISVLIPALENQRLDSSIESVLQQVNENWELYIAGPDALQTWTARDRRIKIAPTIDLALESVAGDFLLLMQPTDRLSPDALAELALYTAENPRADIVYSDNDLIDDTGRRHSPEFKPDWSPEFSRSGNYSDGLFLVRRELAGLKPEIAAERSRKVGHIPQVLYHRRSAVDPAKTSLAEPYFNPHLCPADGGFRIHPRRWPRAPVRPFRVCAFSHALNLTGAPLCQFELTEALVQRGVIESVAACASDGALREWYERAGIPVHDVARYSVASGLLPSQKRDAALAEFGRLMRDQWKIDLLFANTLDSVFAVEAASRAGIPIVWSVHESAGPWFYCNLFGSELLDCFAKPYRVVFCCDATRRIYAAWDSAHNFMTLRNAIDAPRLCSAASGWSRQLARQSLDIQDDQVALLMVGTICSRKGQLDLVRTLHRLPPEVAKRVRCFLVGERVGQYSGDVARAIGRCGKDWTGRISLLPETQDVARFYRAADVFVCCSRVESYPRVTQEAMALGLPVITTPVYGLAEQIQDGVNGLHHQPGNLDELAQAITKLVSDDDLRKRMSDASPTVLASRGDFDSVVQGYGQIFREAYLTGF
jgi:glycosyltransferase involved in cell wall biosynthesis